MVSLAGVAVLTNTPFIFPSLGPTAYLLYFAPRAKASAPRDCLFGHAIALVCGYFALWASGLIDRPPDAEVQVEIARVVSAAASLGLTCFFLVISNVNHPPAGATTLIVALGLITQPWQLVVMELAVAVLLVQAILFNVLAGVPVPGWRGQSSPATS